MVAAATHSLCEAVMVRIVTKRNWCYLLAGQKVEAATHSLCEAANAMVQDILVC